MGFPKYKFPLFLCISLALSLSLSLCIYLTLCNKNNNNNSSNPPNGRRRRRRRRGQVEEREEEEEEKEEEREGRGGGGGEKEEEEGQGGEEEEVDHSASKTEIAHQKFREGRYDEALKLYTDALATAKLLAHRIALHSNRAACFLKQKHYSEARDECSAVLEMDSKHKGSLMLRVHTLIALKDYHAAYFDSTRLLDIDPYSNVYRKLQARLRSHLSLAPILESEEEVSLAEMEENNRKSRLSRILPSAMKPDLKGWEAIPKPKGHSELNYSHWDKLVVSLSDDEDDDDDFETEYKFRVRNVGVQALDEK